ncbi:hypothetical protein K3148_06650 [Qipengyuania aurantiaca]|uniref:DUF995 domain-containing protein n=1 Tax=Qipengyuania aurantiaca TaxID=2867233 RepID=A0ABX8ZSG5_9SPHN|nr:hypothetical protein [Qipengyuania aurantiaca]QZD91054.1 hypothetical protein K3148_06650 [Qipengyuania aurantiaca]
MRMHPAVIALAVGLVACTPQEENSGGSAAEGDTATAEATPTSAPPPDTLAETAWRARSNDGARYVTYLDGDGTYRDLRNGDPFQEGKWSYAEGPEGKQLCFEPEDENGVETCWMPGRTKDGLMAATGPGGRRIELEKVAYEPAGDAEGDAPE